MTDTTATESAVPAPTSTDAAETPAVGTDTPGEAESGSQGENGEASEEPKGRAAQYRKRAQDAEAKVAEVEAQSAELAATVERLQRLHVEQSIAATGLKPAAVFAVAQLSELIGEDGLPDKSKLDAAVHAAQEQLGAAPKPAAVQRQRGMVSGASGYPAGPKSNGWAAAFSPPDD
ncbi:hypothetical protein [Mycobacterium nebraskense]|uniref:Scaffolding protein n=1 Tax=Mycobacterium nebraskense TaxID=244292 RepID=A0A1X1ZFX6_9MYCO|nr:hypothetical protein [Mycobacterium nebraskense]MBI2696153.1 hypothetical protein [Mycobacterium nebraskense]MCV7120325.1 hypothetical protein [Mycobacterium nebraskense]ORW22303.1 hypothetical protein AWC17_05175 [Mycobacterium nebraskense]